jgi:PAS domain S-box-containing protein
MKDGRIIEANDAFTTLSGYTHEEAISSSTLDLNLWVNTGNRQQMMATLREGRPVEHMETVLRAKSGNTRTVLLSAQTIHVREKICVLSIVQDITEHKRTESLLINAQKLDSLGILAGGIAHDFNNLLAGIYGYLDLARTVSSETKVIDYLDSTLSSFNRAKALTMQLLTFAKGGAPVQKIMPLVPFIQESAQFALSGSNISCSFLLDNDLWPCNIDKNQIGQVIDNIVINAQQAMPNGGAIKISARNATIADEEHPVLAAGDYVRVSIEDSGTGIPRDILPRIFDPFYTTKTKGHGLGLATCYSIIKRHGGYIDVASEPGIGSTFHVYLPALRKVVPQRDVQLIKHVGSGTIIIVDDEEVVRQTVQKMLELLGYSVIGKSDGREGLEHYRSEIKAGKRFAAMMLDLTIPGGMGGKDAVTELRKLDSLIPVFVMSGYADDPVMRNPVGYGFTASISKPFTISELSELLNRNLVAPA